MMRITHPGGPSGRGRIQAGRFCRGSLLTVEDLDRKVPFGRIGRPDEVAALVAFLASEEAPFICGMVVEITGAQAVS